jgi:hypothetical protein
MLAPTWQEIGLVQLGPRKKLLNAIRAIQIANPRLEES